jgi:RNA polymerase sigma-70 factor (ECF subfamily)
MTDPLERCFRHEAGRLIAALTRVLGVHNLGLAEDVVQEALCRALAVWRFSGVPENPAAWLMMTAKNCAIDMLRHERTARGVAAARHALDDAVTALPTVEELFGPAAIKDDLLRMMFSCCHPQLAEEAQVALVLHVLCGFSVGEVAGAFLCGEDAIKKRIARSKRTLARSRRLFDLTQAKDFTERLVAVQRALYLLFNEGYHGAGAETAVRVELCQEAMRLAALLLEHPLAATPATHALLALMCFHAARLPSRLDPAGNLSLFGDQDRSRWDRRLIAEGQRLLHLAATGSELTELHVEAGIAALHAGAGGTHDTPWATIVSLYDLLLRIRPSPVVALNRAIAIAQAEGPERGLAEIVAIADRDRLEQYPFYPAAIGELELDRGRAEAARDHFRRALTIARNPTERRFFEQRLRACDQA